MRNRFNQYAEWLSGNRESEPWISDHQSTNPTHARLDNKHRIDMIMTDYKQVALFYRMLYVVVILFIKQTTCIMFCKFNEWVS